MINPSNIIALIQEDAPCVYDILIEETNEDATPDQLLEALTEYHHDNHDVHYWSWRYTQMIEDYNTMEKMISVLEKNKQKSAPFMSEEYQHRIDAIKNVQEFIWKP